MQKSFVKFIKHTNSFDEFITLMKASDLTAKEKGDHWEVLTKHVFLLHPDYKHKTKNIFLHSEIPLSTNEKIKLPPVDKGIDLIWETTDNEFYAVQSKFRSSDNTIPWKEVSTFVGLSFGVATNIKKGIFVTNQDTVCKELESDKFIRLYGDFWDNLPKHFFKNIRRLHKKKELKIDKITPRAYQMKIIQNTYEYFNGIVNQYNLGGNVLIQNFSRGILNMGTGVGKTVNSLWICEELDCNTVLYVVPSLNLLSQTYSEWVKYIKNTNVKFLLIGSDADSEIKENATGLILTVSQDEILAWIEKNKNEKTVIMSTYQSAHLLCDQGLTFEIGIFDEAHRTVGQKGSMFTKLLYDENLVIEKRLFMTATPRFYAGENDEITSMDDVEVYGNVIYKYDVAMALNDGVLTDYEILHLHVTDKQLEQYLNVNQLVKMSDEVKESVPIASAIMLLKGMLKHGFGHIVTYHNTVERAQTFCETLKKLAIEMQMDELEVMHVEGSFGMKKRRKCFDDFKKAKKAIMCTARVLNEGVNMPIIDCVCFVDARKSVTDIVQCIGRCLRKKKGKKKAYVLIPNVLGEDLEGAYKNIWTIVRAMSMTDNGIIEYVKLKSMGVNGTNGCRKFGNENVLIDVAEDIDIEIWINEIENQLWKNADGFEVMYEKLKIWVEKNKKIPNTKSKNETEKQLGSFCANNRSNKRKGILCEKNILKLESIPNWYWDKDDPFYTTCEQFTEFVKVNSRFPSKANESKHEKLLDTWVTRIRKQKKLGNIDSDKQKLLENIPGWFWDKDELFHNMLQEVKIWVDDNNKLPSQHSKDDYEKKLGSWCSVRRIERKKGKLTDEKQKILEQIPGWFWNKEDIFNEIYESIKAWIDDNKSFPSLNSTDKIEKRFALMINTKRKNYQKGLLPVHQIEQLEKINDWSWSIQNEVRNSFGESYEELKKWIKIHKKLPYAKANDLTEKRLGGFCQTQRKDKKNNKLDSQKIKLLEKLPGWYWDQKDWFLDTYNELIKWVELHDKIPSHGSTDPMEKKLGSFCKKQRGDKKKNNLCDERVKLLEKLSGWFWQR